MTDKIDELKFTEGQAPQKIGEERVFTPFIGREVGEKLVGSITERELVSIRDGVAYIKYSIKTPTPDDEYASHRMSISIEKFNLEGEYDNYFYIPEQDRQAIAKSNEEIFELFAEVVKEDTQTDRMMKPRISNDTIRAIETELDYQDDKWGNKEQSLPGYLLIMKKELEEAFDGWMKNSTGRNSPLHEIVQVVSVGIQCLEQYGTTGITINTNDIRDDRYALSRLVYQATTPGFEPIESTAFTAPDLNIPRISLKRILGDPTSVDEILEANGVVHMEIADTSQQVEEKE